MTHSYKVRDLMTNPPLAKKEEEWKIWTKEYSKREKEVLNLLKSPKSLFRNALKKAGIVTAFYLQPREHTNEVSWGDYGSSLFVEEFGDKVIEQPYIIFEMRVDLEKKRLDPIKDRYFQHGIENLKDVDNVHRIFQKWFPGEYEWNGKIENAIHLNVKS